MKKFLAGLLLLVGSAFAQGPTTPNLGLNIPLHGTLNWDAQMNQNFVLLDNFLSGSSPLPTNLVVTGNFSAGTFSGTIGGNPVFSGNINFSGNPTFTGTAAFSQKITSTVATGTPPFSVNSTDNVVNLNASTLNGANFASPGPIGSTTPGSGTFTTINGVTQISDGVACPAADQTCFAGITADNRTYRISGKFVFSSNLVFKNFLHINIECAPGTSILPATVTNGPLVQFLGGEFIYVRGCEAGGLAYTTGLVSIAAFNATTATLSVPLTGALQAFMAGGALFIPGAAPLPDTSLTRGQGVVIASSPTTTTLTIAQWKGKAPLTNVPFHISYGDTGTVMQAIDEICSISGGSISGDGSKVTVSLAAGVNCNVKNLQMLTVYGTGTLGSGASADSYNRPNQGPISVVSGCSGVGACSFTYPSSLNLGAASVGTIALKMDHIYFEHNYFHDGGNLAVASQNTDPQDAVTQVWLTDNIMEYCVQNCFSGNRMSELHFKGNICRYTAMGGVTGNCYNSSQAVDVFEADDEADVEGNNGDGYHSVFQYGGQIGQGLHVHDVPLRNVGGTNNHSIHCDLCQRVVLQGADVGCNVAAGSTSLASSKTGIRWEAPAGGAIIGNSICDVGGAAITVNSRLEQNGSGLNGASLTTSTASCVNSGINACGTPSGHQIFNADTQTAQAGVTITPSDGSGGSFTFTSGALTTATGATCGAGTTPKCTTDVSNKLEGAASQKICAGDCTAATAFPAGRIVYVNLSACTGTKCINGNINTLSDFVFRIGIGAPSIDLVAGDIAFCISSLPNLVAPEACQDLPFMKANSFVYIPFIFPNYGQLLDNPGIASAGFIAKAGGTTAYAGFWTDDWAVDVPNGLDGTTTVANNTISRPQGTCFAISGGVGVNIIGNNATDCGFGGLGPAPFYGIYFDNSLNNSQLDNGPPTSKGSIKGNTFRHTLGISAVGSTTETCIKLNIGAGPGAIDGVIVDPTGCVPGDWTQIFDPTTATHFSPVDRGTCTLSVAGACPAQTLYFPYKNAPQCQVSWASGTAPAGALKVVYAAGPPATVTPTSSNAGDTATVVNWSCLIN